MLTKYLPELWKATELAMSVWAWEYDYSISFDLTSQIYTAPLAEPIASEVPSGWNLFANIWLSSFCSQIYVSCSESHNLKVLSSPPETMSLESGLNSAALIQLLWAAIVLKCLAVAVW